MNVPNQISTDKLYEDVLKGNGGFAFVNKVLSVILVVVITFTIGFFAGSSGIIKYFSGGVGSSDTGIKSYSEEELASILNLNAYDFSLYKQIAANLKSKYVDPSKIDDRRLFESSLKGLVAGAGDPNTVYMTAEEHAKYNESFSGKFEGIGVRLGYEKNRIVVTDVIPDSPAQGAGVKEGYVFTEVDGNNVESDSLDQLVSKVRGPVGSIVRIKFYDPLSNGFVEKEIKRAAVTVESLRLIEINSDTVVFEVSRFTESTLDEWKRRWDTAVAQINSKGYRNVILDLRGNLGGYLDAGVHAANDFLGRGSLILTERTRDSGDREVRSTKISPALTGKNVVILVNGGTASASEILVGALRFHKKYKVVGVKTFGKGTVQQKYSLPNSGALKVTTEYWLLPDGKRLDHENPIVPDVIVEQDPQKVREGKDPQLDAALDLLGW